MNILTTLNGITPYNENSYATFSQVMDKAYTELSFWGERYVYSVGYQGSIPLIHLVERVRDLVDSNPEFSEAERIIGKSIQNKVSNLVDISWDQVERVSYIRSLIFWIIEVFTKRSMDLHYIDLPFNYRTANQFREKYQKDPDIKNSAGYFCKGKNQGRIPIWMEE